MAYPTIIPQDQFTNHIVQTWLNMNEALLQLREKGLTGLFMPDEIKFDAILLDEVQTIPILTTTTGTDTAVTSAATSDVTDQTTTHGETVNTIDNGQTLYVSGDLQTGMQVSGNPYLNPPVTLPF